MHNERSVEAFGASRRRQKLLGVCAAALTAAILLGPIPGYAQTGGEAASSNEIVVTARRRDESLSRAPVAVTAFRAEELVERSIRTDSDLQLVTPGLTIRQTQGNNSLTYSLRGQTADTFSGTPSAVVTYLNEVPLTIAGASSFFDLESVQVLKGPQGTLFGRNATGGAVLYTSARPVDEFEASLRVRAGNLELRELEGMINVPVSDSVLFRAAFNTIDREGYINNLLDGENLGELGRDSARLSLTLRPSENLENLTVVQATDTDGSNTGASYTYSAYPCGATNNGFVLTCAASFVYPGLQPYLAEQRAIGPYNTRHPGGARHTGNDWMVTNTTSYDISDSLRVRNILGASHAETDSEQPQLGAPFATILTANTATGDSGNELQVDSFSEELQLQGEWGSLTYVLGLYVQRQETETVWPQTYFSGAVTTTNAFRTDNDTDAVYAQGTYDLASATGVDGLRLTAGLRHTREEVRFEVFDRDTRPGLVGTRESATFEDPSWELGLEYQATDELFAYIKTRGSFRSGGFNGAAPPVPVDATAGGNLFDSEHTQDVELGLKYRGEAFGRPAALNVAVYRQEIEDVQRVEFPDPDGPGGIASIAVTANVPEMVVQGVELDGSFMPAEWLEIGGYAAFTDAEFTDGRINLFGTPYQYGPVGDTPETSGVLYAQASLPTPDRIGDVSIRAEVYSQSEQFFSNAANSIAPGTRLPGYTLVSGRVQWDGIMGSNVSAALFGRNLTEEEYFTGGMTLAAALGHNAAAVGEPRTYGIELSYRY